ncbi:MAG: IS21-like element helper ATPase IstB [Desulfurivibrio sp.]|nr:IS21-like element helper ATPase IstB [Desulfurivibrio sp.]
MNQQTTEPLSALAEQLGQLKLSFMTDNYQEIAKKAAKNGWGHLDFLAKLAEGELHLRYDRATIRRVKNASFPVIKSIDQFAWDWPKKINRMAVQNLHRLHFIEQKANVIFLGTVGLGKTHLAISLGHSACLAGHSVLFTTAVEALNNLHAAQQAGRFKAELKKYLSPKLLIIDELGYLPIDKLGADLLFQIISQRYERGAIIITTNRAYKDWPQTFNNDSTLTAAILDRLLHHAETEVIEGDSYRMKSLTA